MKDKITATSFKPQATKDKRPATSYKLQALSFKQNKSHVGMVFLYVLFSVSLFIIIFTSLLFLFNTNYKFISQTSILNKLENEGNSTAEKILGLFAVNPKSSLLLAEVNNAKKRKIELTSYHSTMEGYVYNGKTDLIVLDPKEYIAGQTLPSKITITNHQESNTATPLFVIARVINRQNNIVLASQIYQVNKGETSEDINLFSLAAGDSGNVDQEKIAINDRLEKFFEIILFSDASKGSLYAINTGSSDTILGANFTTSVTLYEFSYDSDVGMMRQGISDSLTDDESYNMFSKNDFGAGNFSSSASVPGLSTAYIDTFELDSSDDWECTGGSPSYSNGDFHVPQGASCSLKKTISGNFDMRVTLKKPTSTQPFETGVFINIGGTTYRAAAKKDVTVYSKDTCAESTINDAYITYTGFTAPSFGNRDTGCTTLSTDWKDFSSADTFMLRFVRKNGNLDAYVCKNDMQCDVAEYNWPLINDNSLNAGTEEVTVGLYSQNQEGIYPYFRVARLDPITYRKDISFGSDIEIKEVRMNGNIPASAQFMATVKYKKSGDDTEYTSGDYNSLIFQPVPSSNDRTQHILLADTLTLILQLTANSGELADIPFIRGIEVPNIEIPPSCTPDCKDRVCGTDLCGGLCGVCENGKICSIDGQCDACQNECSLGQVGCDGLVPWACEMVNSCLQKVSKTACSSVEPYSSEDTCYYGAVCSAGECGADAMTSKPALYYAQDALCYFNCNAVCGATGWVQTGCSADMNKQCTNALCTASGWDNTTCCQSTCTVKDALRCANGGIEKCTQIPAGCLQWQVYSCDSGEVCYNDQCCAPTEWTGDPANTCIGQTVTQTSNCGTTRTVPGTKVCDTTPPQCTIVKNPSLTAWTNSDIVATATCSDSGSACTQTTKTYTFTDNESHTFTFTDNAGNQGSCSTTVSNIDKIDPICGTWSSGTTSSWIKSPASATFTLDGSRDALSGINVDGGTCSISGSPYYTQRTCSFTISDNADNTRSCTSSMSVGTLESNLLYWKNNGTINYQESTKLKGAGGKIEMTVNSTNWPSGEVIFFQVGDYTGDTITILKTNENILILDYLVGGTIYKSVSISWTSGTTHTIIATWNFNRSGNITLQLDGGTEQYTSVPSMSSFWNSFNRLDATVKDIKTFQK